MKTIIIPVNLPPISVDEAAKHATQSWEKTRAQELGTAREPHDWQSE